jgi:hypothetical protein
MNGSQSRAAPTGALLEKTRDGETLTAGVEAFVDHLGQRALLITVF